MPQVVVQENSLEVEVDWPTVRLPVPVLVSVTGWAADVAPTLVEGNVRLAGAAVRMP